MKAIENKILETIMILMILLWLPLAAQAADMWAETPDLNDNSGSAAFITESHTLRNKSVEVDMWAETPDLDNGSENHGVKIDGGSRFVRNFNWEMYAETPGLHDTLPGPRPENMENPLIAKEK